MTNDFHAFLSSEETPPGELSRAILDGARSALHPSYARVMGKLALIQLVMGSFILLFCPQLGVGPLVADIGLMDIFMRFGSVACALTCGALFLGGSLLLAGFCLRPEELRTVKKRQLLNVSVLAALSFVSLILLGGSIDALWLVGSVAGGWLSLQLGGAVRLGRRRLVG